MSNIYIQEPPTNGKVLLVTSQGEVDIELWSKEAPKACRNFVQLCLEGYYDGTIFHRIVKGFIIQGGDPTGTGSGGESIYGTPFKDEFHQRLKFNRRGLVAMANAGPNDNHSQFFFTLDKTDELNKKHTIFGKIAGKTIFNVLRMVDIEVDEDDRPLEPPRIIKTEVLLNPFDDIIPRELSDKSKSKEDSKKHVSKSKATKNYKLLSFGEEAEDDEEETDVASKDIKIASSHDLLKDPKLSAVPAVEQKTLDEDREKLIQQDIRDKLTKRKGAGKEERSSFNRDEDAKDKRMKELKKESRKLKRELKEKPTDAAVDDNVESTPEEKSPVNELMKQIVEEREEFVKKQDAEILKKGSKRQAETMALLESFQTKIMSLPQDKSEDEDEVVGDGWMTHKLVFEEDPVKAKDANIRDEDTFDIYDPRNPINKRRREKSKSSHKDSRHKRHKDR